jgi:hypothetical protein
MGRALNQSSDGDRWLQISRIISLGRRFNEDIGAIDPKDCSCVAFCRVVLLSPPVRIANILAKCAGDERGEFNEKSLAVLMPIIVSSPG